MSTPPSRTDAVQAAAVDRCFREAGCAGSLHVLDLDGAREFGVNADRAFPSASVFKLQVAVAFWLAVDRGELEPEREVRLAPAPRVVGPTGIAQLQDEVRASLRDLVALMLTISDNAATDAVMAAVGLEGIRRVSELVGLRHTEIRGDVRWVIDQLAQELGYPSFEALLDTNPEVSKQRMAEALQPQRTNCTSASDSTRLLAALWRDQVLSASAGAELRRRMASQLVRQRLAAAYPRPHRVAAKSGSLAGVVRNEVGVVEREGGGRYAVGVFSVQVEPGADEVE
ncbi:MAG: serine hydrolase, partial [Streptosporangiaceae bacterium]